MRKLVVLVSVALLLLTAAGSASATHKWAIQWCEEEVDAWLVDTETVGLRFFSAGIRKAPVSQGPMIPSLGWGNLIVAFTAYTGFVEWAYEYRLSSSLEHVGGLAMVYDESAGDYWIVVAAESAEGLVLVTLDMRDGAVVSVRSYVAEGGTITPGMSCSTPTTTKCSSWGGSCHRRRNRETRVTFGSANLIGTRVLRLQGLTTTG